MRRVASPRLWRQGRWFVLLATVLWGAGFMAFLAAVPRRVAEPEPPTEGILVLTGGSGRIDAGLALLRAGRGQRLLISGLHPGAGGRWGRPVGALPLDEPKAVAFGFAATDTLGNALEAAAWIERFDLRSVRVVTAAYHMPRSLLLLSRKRPDVLWMTHPVFPPAVDLDRWWWPPGIAMLLIGEYHKYAAALLYDGLDRVVGGRLSAGGLEQWWAAMPRVDIREGSL
jgi:uncharacterized SAM-binding protein YcdF (DUF218 family)